jgi:tetratricopeptide (TPR) repeat protein
VYLSAFNDPRGFAFRTDVVMNTEASFPFGDTSKFFSIVAHEIFHIGYFDVQLHQTEVWSDYYPVSVLQMTLQNDGLAVYTQYLVASQYPARLELQLLYLESDLAMSMLIGQVNDLFRETEVLSEEEIMSKVYEASTRTALYVVGAHMARTIDEELSREALVETVVQGPRSFIAAYNSVAEPGREIYEIPEPSELSVIQVLRQAALEGDLEGVAEAIVAIEAAEIEDPGGAVFEHLMSTSQLLLRLGESGLAVDVSQLMVSLFPDHPYSYLYLGNALDQNGEYDKAQEAYLQAVEIDPRMEGLIGR